MTAPEIGTGLEIEMRSGHLLEASAVRLSGLLRQALCGVAALLILVSFGNGLAHAWGDSGHRIICQVAYRLASQRSRDAIDFLLQPGPNFFADACTWADHPRKRATEHYVNLPREAKGLGPIDCPLSAPCLVSAIRLDSERLHSNAVSASEKADALKYLGHWVGDLHQPLHVSFEDDLGGNKTAAGESCRSRNLHAVWDGCLVDELVQGNEEDFAAELFESITAGDISRWTEIGLTAWVDETFALAKNPSTRYCLVSEGSCSPSVPAYVNVDANYKDSNKLVVRLQLMKAAVRLGYLLDRALGP